AYRMTATDDAGVERHTTGVIGALELSPPGTDILPHEHTTKKAKSDRLDLLRSCRANLSAIWGLSLAKGLTDLHPVVVADGHHRYETSLAYKGEREAAEGSAGDAGATMTYIVELVEDELTVH